ncbi:MAG: helix-turn-helix domain-containing protein [Comamonadaceae bacterium]|nr:MAG: helix-turn-helix domain-containing protein [Comamonadaceae bacterium]
MSEITADHLSRRACVYVRQSTPDQVQNNLESQRRQYALVERAHQLGWQQVEVIDDDLGRSGSGTSRPGFDRLLRLLCDGEVGAVLSTEASRLARNGRDWHTLLEFCSVVGALLIDAEGIYDPAQMNDRLLLGMKGTISEMELASFRQRAHEAMKQKAKRGELFMRVPIGYVRTIDDRIEKDPDERVRAAIDLVLRKFAEFGSARRLYFWLLEQCIDVPAVAAVGSSERVQWKAPRYHSLLSLLQNPIYAGVYSYGRSKTSVRIEDGRKRVVRTRHRKAEDWSVMILDHHEGYIDWEAYRGNQELMAHNTNGRGGAVRGSIRSGSALLSGLLRCGHCGAKLCVAYPGATSIRYQCTTRILSREHACCVMFGGLGADRLVAERVLSSLEPMGLQAALQAIESLQGVEDERLAQKRLALQRARYEVSRAQRQYDAVDPANRLVAGSLEKRWNDALAVQSRLEDEVAELMRQRPDALSEETKEAVLALAEDLPRLWDHPETSPDIKKRILRTVVKEIVVTSEGDSVRFIVHWQGGDHTEMRLKKTPTGLHSRVTSAETIELITSLARLQPDERIAATINRLGHRTAHGQTWTAARVCSIRKGHGIAVYREGERQERDELTVDEVAAVLQVTHTTVLRLIRQKDFVAKQACRHAPWTIRQADLDVYLAARAEQNPSTRVSGQLALDIQ